MEETELYDGEKEGVFSRTARRLELLGFSLIFRSDCSLIDISKLVLAFFPAKVDTLFREIFRLIASNRSCFNSSLGRAGASGGLGLPMSDWFTDVCRIWLFNSFISLVSNISAGVTETAATLEGSVDDIEDASIEDTVDETDDSENDSVVESSNARVDLTKSGVLFQNLNVVDFVTFVTSGFRDNDLCVVVVASVARKSSVVETGKMTLLLLSGRVVVVGLVLTTTVDALVVVVGSWVVRTISLYSSLPLNVLSLLAGGVVAVVVTVLALLLNADRGFGLGEVVSGWLEFTADLNGRRILRFLIRSRLDGL